MYVFMYVCDEKGLSVLFLHKNTILSKLDSFLLRIRVGIICRGCFVWHGKTIHILEQSSVTRLLLPFTCPWWMLALFNLPRSTLLYILYDNQKYLIFAMALLRSLRSLEGIFEKNAVLDTTVLLIGTQKPPAKTPIMTTWWNINKLPKTSTFRGPDQLLLLGWWKKHREAMSPIWTNPDSISRYHKLYFETY